MAASGSLPWDSSYHAASIGARIGLWSAPTWGQASMGNWQPHRAQLPRVLDAQARRSLRSGRQAGLSRRTLIRRSIAAAVGLWVIEVLGGTLGFLWPNLTRGFGGVVTLGDFGAVAASPAVTDLTITDGAPSYFQNARSYVTLLNPATGFATGSSPDGDGATTNVRTLYQRCTHLGCKPNFCPTNFWFECPCHGSRYDRLGIKVADLGPAPRSLDRFAHVVSADGVLTVDTSKITLGPLPVALGQPGLLPPRSATGCI
jgi:cytochrome b6-f complex iron-sulfur subunit